MVVGGFWKAHSALFLRVVGGEVGKEAWASGIGRALVAEIQVAGGHSIAPDGLPSSVVGGGEEGQRHGRMVGYGEGLDQ